MDFPTGVYYNLFWNLFETMEVHAVKVRLALMLCALALMLCALALMLSGCGYWLVEDAPVRVGSPEIRATLPPALSME